MFENQSKMNNQQWIAVGDQIPPEFVWVWIRLKDGSEWRGHWTGCRFAIGELARLSVSHWCLY